MKTHAIPSSFEPTEPGKVPFVAHGGPDLAELHRLGIDASTVMDFSVCTNPYGPSPRVQEALAGVCVAKYPDPQCHALRASLAGHCSISPGNLLIGNGVSELIWLVALAFVRPRDRVLVVGPTYGEYARSVTVQRGTLHLMNSGGADGFVLDPHDVAEEIGRLRPHMVFLCNPNNPTGTTIATDGILSWVQGYPHTLFVLDEAYQAFARGLGSLVGVRENNLLILRSMTKDYALAGLRIGYVVGTPERLAELERVRPPWNVNAMAQSAALAALGDECHLAQTLDWLRSTTCVLKSELQELGLKIVPSATHYFLSQVGDASGCRLALLRKGVLVRDCTSFGLPEYIRIASGRAEENAHLLWAVREVIA